MPVVPVAVIQAAGAAFDLDETLQRVERWLERAQGAQLVLFPEAFIGGYPKGLDFGARVGVRTPPGRAMFERYYAGAIELDSPATRHLGSLARRHGTHLVMGAIERDGGTLYCSVLCFGPEGTLIGRRRKLVPTAVERVVWGRGDGSSVQVFDTAIGKLGAVICWENYMPLLRTALYGLGVQIYCAPTVDDRDTWLPTMRHIAVEGRCFVVSACQYATRSDFPAEYPTAFGDDPSTVLISGGSCIVDPMGTVVAGPVRDRQEVLTAELDLDAIVRGKYDLDVVGHYARPDVFALHVDRRAKSGLRFDDADEAVGGRSHHPSSVDPDRS